MQITGRHSQRQSEKQPAKVAKIARIAAEQFPDRQPLQLTKSDSMPSANRALVPVHQDTGRIARPVSRAGRMFAPLVTHLVATRLGVPQTRNRRRASADHANNMYRDVANAPQVQLKGNRASKYL